MFIDIDWRDYPAGFLDQTLDDDGVHLWSIEATADNIAAQSDAERLACLDIKDEIIRKHQSAAQGGLRRVLAAYGASDHRQISISRTTHGKPFVAQGPEFNLSHTRDRIYVAVANQPVGLDVEALDRPVRAGDLMRKFFHEEEQSLFAGLDATAATNLFLRLWVCKEAMVKLTGEGISHGLRDARVRVAGDMTVSGEYAGREMYLWPFQPAPGFVAAVATWEKEHVKCFFRL